MTWLLRRQLKGFGWRIAIAHLLLFAAAAAVVSVVVLRTIPAVLPEQQALSVRGPVMVAVVVGLAATVALAATISALLLRSTYRVIGDITRGARAVAAGQLEGRIYVPPSGQSRDAALAFNRMSSALRIKLNDLEQEKDTLSTLIATMSEGVVHLEGTDVVAFANPAAEALFSTPLTPGRRFIEVVRDYEIHRLLGRCLDTRASQQAVLEVGPQQKYVAVTVSPVVYEDAGAGDVASVLLVFYDLTEVRRVERSRREFVANVSHELRTPLTTVKAAVDTLQDGALEDRAVAIGFLQRINSEVDRMANLVADLLELSRLESGHVVPHRTPLDLALLIQEAVERFAMPAAQNEVTLRHLLSDAAPQVSADADMVRQVLSNLLDNAIKYTAPSGSVEISARTANGNAVVTVADTGQGIPREHVPHVFERFYKVERARREGGTGLGLAIVKHIVQAHGGDVFVESQEGAGSTFVFTLPLE